MHTQPIKTVKPDAKGRITLGALAEGISSFAVFEDKHHRLILEPCVQIPLREQWLWKNKKALADLRQGIKESMQGKATSMGSFAKYVDED